MKHDARLQAAIDARRPEWTELPGSAAEARERQAAGWPPSMPKLLFTGRACARGHISPRRVSGYCCRACELEDRSTPQAKAKEKAYAQRPEVVARRRAWEQERYGTSEEFREARKRYLRERFKDPEVKAAHTAYMRENQATRDARKLRATPDWLTSDQHDEIKRFYTLAIQMSDETGIPHHVDHIIPLRHPGVCGLHVPWNLQVLTADENIGKNNAFDGTMDNDGWRVPLAHAVAAE